MSRRQTTLRPSQGGRFAGPVGSPVPAAAGDVAVELREAVAASSTLPVMLPRWEDAPPRSPSPSPKQTRSPPWARLVQRELARLERRMPGGVIAYAGESPRSMAVLLVVENRGACSLGEEIAYRDFETSRVDLEAVVDRLCVSVCGRSLSPPPLVPKPRRGGTYRDIFADLDALERDTERAREKLSSMRDRVGRRWVDIVADYVAAAAKRIAPEVQWKVEDASHAPGAWGVTVQAILGEHRSDGFMPQWELAKHATDDTLAGRVADLVAGLARHVRSLAHESKPVGTIGGVPVFVDYGAAGPTPDQAAAEIRSVRQKIEPAREPLTGTSFSGMPGREPSTGTIPPPFVGATDDAPPAAVDALNAAIDRARRRHPELAFGVRWREQARPRAWRIFASDVDETRSIDVTLTDILATRGADLDADLDRLAGMFGGRDPGPTDTLWRIVNSTGRHVLAGYPGAEDMGIRQEDQAGNGCTIVIRDNLTGEETCASVRVDDADIVAREPGGDVVVKTGIVPAVASRWTWAIALAVARRKTKMAREA